MSEVFSLNSPSENTIMENSWDRKSNKRLRSSTNSGSEDRISHLPDAIAQHILCFLPAKEAIKTCVLSKRWESLWTSIPDLLFHCESDHCIEVREFASFVDKTLMKYTSTEMNKFSLQCCANLTAYLLAFDHVDSWLGFVENCAVKELNMGLCLTQCKPRSNWPKSMYTNSSVIKMSLNSFYFDGGLKGFHWKSLKILSLTNSTMGNDMIRSILEGSPLIECLTLRGCRLYDLGRIDASGTKLKELVIDGMCRSDSPIDIVAPNLQSLTIVQFINNLTFNLVDVSSSLEANMDFIMGMLSYNREKKILKDLVQTLTRINKLTVGIRYCQDNSTENAICARFPPGKLKSLEVDIKSTIWCRPGLSALLYSSLDAEQLTINLKSLNHHEFKQEKFFGNNEYLRQPKRRYLIRHLKSVKIIVPGSCSNSKNVLFEVVKYLLDNANALQKLIIHAGLNCSTSAAPKTFEELYEITQKLLSYPRASADALVLFESHLE